MAAARKEAQLRDGLCVVFVRVEEFLGYKVLRVATVASEFDIEVCKLISMTEMDMVRFNIPLGMCIYVLPW